MMKPLICLAVAVSCVSAAEPAGWKLVWADEFGIPGLPDAAKWKPETGMVRNGEKQYYTKDRQENARVEDGRLIIEARKEAYEARSSPRRA